MLNEYRYSPAVPFPMTPPWFDSLVYTDFYIQEIIQKHKGKGNWADIDEEKFKTTHTDFQIYTDGSKEPSGHIGFAFVIPNLNIIIKKRTSDHFGKYTAELLAVLMVLQWTWTENHNMF